MTDTELDTIVDYRQSCAAVRDAMQDEIDQIAALLKTELGERGTRRVERGAWVVQMIAQARATLNKKKLLSVGVTTQQIEQATETTQVEVLRIDPRAATGGG
jgi:hypothetical protein